MKPIKFKINKFKDNRGILFEIFPKKIKLKFNYSILTVSHKNVLRGMHYNRKMDEEKIVVILDGSIFDVIIDLNAGKNFGKIYYHKLYKNDALYIPRGFAHGYSCIGIKNSILYFLNKKYSKENNYGFAWDDDYFNIKWNNRKPILSKKDKNLKNYFKN